MNDESKTPDQPAPSAESPAPPTADPALTSGSRWEPASGEPVQPVTAQLSDPIPYDPVPGYAPAAPTAEPTTGRLRTRLGLAAATVGLVALGGAGGFALGHAAADNPRQDFSQGNGFPGGGLPGNGQRPDFGGDHREFDHDGLGGQQGQAPGTNQESGTDT